MEWSGNIQEEPYEAEDTEHRNPDEASLSRISVLSDPTVVPSPLSLITACPSLSERINPVLPQYNIMAYPGAVAMQDKIDSPQDTSPKPPFASTSITILVSQWALQGVSKTESLYSKRIPEYLYAHKCVYTEIQKTCENGY